MEGFPQTTLFDFTLADDIQNGDGIDSAQAEKIFGYFKESNLFRWSDANNDCEDRANAICLLLDKWGIPNYKAWVFSGYFLKKEPGWLNNYWNYHVAAALLVQDENTTGFYVIDPATSAALIPIDKWAMQVTEYGTSYHFIKHGNYYIFPSQKIRNDNWHKRDKRNFNWTMQGLSGINGASAKGRAQLAFHKKKVLLTEKKFKTLLNARPIFVQ